MWAFNKNYIRRNNDVSNLKKYLLLLEEARKEIKEHVLNKKLWRRFWNIIKAYKNGDSCLQVLQKYFSFKFKADVKENRKIVITEI